MTILQLIPTTRKTGWTLHKSIRLHLLWLCDSSRTLHKVDRDLPVGGRQRCGGDHEDRPGREELIQLLLQVALGDVGHHARQKQRLLLAIHLRTIMAEGEGEKRHGSLGPLSG